jgi:hypothetical protein
MAFRALIPLVHTPTPHRRFYLAVVNRRARSRLFHLGLRLGSPYALMDDIPSRSRFELRRLAECSDAAILAELRRVAALVPDRAFLESDFERLGRVGRNTIRRRFGSWFKALGTAGLAHRSTDQIKTRGGHASSRMSDDEILSVLRELAVKLARTTLTKSDVFQHLPFSDEILRKRWGTMRAAFEAAGLEATTLGRGNRFAD